MKINDLMEMASYFEISHGFNDTSNFKYLFRELVELGMPERYQHVAYDYIRRNLSEEGKKIFNDIFYEYNSIYLENKNNNNNDLISPKSFRENFEENLNKKIEPFQCFNLSLDRRILLDKKKSSSKY